MNENNSETFLLHKAVLDNDVEEVEKLIEKGADLNLTDEKGLKPLHLAILSNNEKIIDKFLGRSEFDMHAFELTIMLDNSNLFFDVRMCEGIEKIQKIQNSQGENLVHYSVKYRSIHCLKECIAYKFNLNDVDARGYSPLHLAVIHNDTEIVEFLLKSGANVYAKTLDGRSAIHLAVKYQCFETLLKLIDSNIDVNDPITTTGLYPLHIAVENNDEKTVYLLIRAGGDIQCTDKEGKNLLHVAVANGHENMVNILLKKGVKVDARFGVKEHSVLDLAFIKEKSKIIPAVLNYHPDINSKNKDGLNALFVAIKSPDYLKSVKELFLLKPDFNTVTNNNDSLLHYALQYKIEYIVNYCLENNVNIDVINNQGYNVLHIAVQYSDVKVVSQLIHKGLDVNSRTNTNVTPLHIAVTRNTAAVVEILLNNGADVNAVNDDGQTPLHYMFDNAFFQILCQTIKETVILLFKKKTNINVFDNDGKTPLYYLIINIRYGFSVTELVLLFIEHGANIKTISKDGDSILHIYFLQNKSDQQSIIDLFLESGGNINQLNINNQTPLQVYLNNNHLKQKARFEYLLQKGAILTKNEMGENALHVAIKRSAENIVQILLQKKLIDLNDDTTVDGSTMLHYAIKYGKNNKILHAILRYYKEMNVRDNEGKTPLHLAVIRDSIKSVEILLSKNADVNAIDKLENSPLCYAISKKNVEMIRLLLHKGASTSGTHGGLSIYDLAKQTGNEHIYHMVMFFIKD